MMIHQCMGDEDEEREERTDRLAPVTAADGRLEEAGYLELGEVEPV